MILYRLRSLLVLPALAAAAATGLVRGKSPDTAEFVTSSAQEQHKQSHNAQATLAAVDGLGRLMIQRRPRLLAAGLSRALDSSGPAGVSAPPSPSGSLPAHADIAAMPEEQAMQAASSTTVQLGIFPAPQHPHHLWSFAFIERRWHASRDIAISGKSQSEQQRSEPLLTWFSGLLLSLLVIGLLMARAGESLKVDLRSSNEAELAAMRGRQCWTFCCACSVALLSVVVFLSTLLVLKAMSWRFHGLVPQSGSSTDDNGLVMDSSGAIRYAKHPGERAYEAAQGVALSVALACFVILRWRRHDSVQINWALLAQFAVRGATLSAVLATVLELLGSVCLSYEGIVNQADGPLPDAEKLVSGGYTFGLSVLMLVVGISEEFAKACAVVWGTWFSAAAVQRALPQSCGKGCTVLVESPRALMLAGLSVGCGFMTVENAGYLVASSLSYDKDDSAFADRIVRVVVILTRAGLNLHPWLTGITSARLARIVFSRSDGLFTVREFAQALLLSVLIHSVFDLLILVLPSLLTLLLPLAFWCATRHVFYKEWASFEPAPELTTGNPTETLEERRAGWR